jgi:hypothetical protein
LLVTVVDARAFRSTNRASPQLAWTSEKIDLRSSRASVSVSPAWWHAGCHCRRCPDTGARSRVSRPDSELRLRIPNTVGRGARRSPAAVARAWRDEALWSPLHR